MRDNSTNIRSQWSSFRRFGLSLGILAVHSLLPTSAKADTLRQVALIFEGSSVSLKISPLSDGKDVYVPLEALAAFHATYTVTRREETAIVKFPNGETTEIALARPGRIVMIPLSQVLRPLHLESSLKGGVCDIHAPMVKHPLSTIIRTEPKNSDPQNATISRGNSSSPLVKPQTDGRTSTEQPKIVTSIPTKIADWLKDGNVPKKVPATPVTVKSTIKVSPDKVDPSDKPLQISSIPGNVVQHAQNIDAAQLKDVKQPQKVVGTTKDVILNANTTPTAKSDKVLTLKSAMVQGIKGPAKLPAIAEITDFKIEENDPDHVQIKIKSDSAIHAFAKVAREPTRLYVEIPNSRVDVNHPDWFMNDNFVSDMRITSGSLPNCTRFVLELARSVKFNIASDNLGSVTVSLSAPQPRRNGIAGLVVVIDPGHGGASSPAPNGCETRVNGQVVYEKNITLAVAMKTREVLEEAGIKVILTRDSDYSVPLETRPKIATDAGADMFISIHVDDLGATPSGHTSYYHADDPASKALATAVIEQLAHVSGLPNRRARSDYSLYKREGLSVLRHATVPATLVEMGFLNNPYDRAKLLTAEYQELVAKSILAGISDFVQGVSFDGMNGVIEVRGTK